ncbi:MAG: hypothetical protein KME16_10015 [Scytolyngbya sp. HA4215-MV1]|jgi:hypothetical protein|nr:hypothetical protein [Scytolyngbya sp. HA4215-MV1]
MNRTPINFRIVRYLLTSALVLPPIWAGLQANVLANCTSSASNCGSKTDNAACTETNRTPYDLYADTQTAHKVKLSWEVCQKSNFYQVSWNLVGGAPTMVQVNDANTLNWTLTRVRDEAKFTFKVRGCNTHPNAEPECTPWTELTVKTPDWD